MKSQTRLYQARISVSKGDLTSFSLIWAYFSSVLKNDTKIDDAITYFARLEMMKETLAVRLREDVGGAPGELL